EVVDPELWAAQTPSSAAWILRDVTDTNITGFVDNFVDRITGEVPEAVPDKTIGQAKTLLKARSTLPDLSEDTWADIADEPEEKPEPKIKTLADILKERDLRFLARVPAAGKYGTEALFCDFTYDKILYYETKTGNLGLLAAASERNKDSLDNLAACQLRTLEGDNTFTQMGSLIDERDDVFHSLDDILTLKGGTRVFLNEFTEGGQGTNQLYYNLLTGNLEVLKFSEDKLLKNEWRHLKELKEEPGIINCEGLIKLADGRECLVMEYCEMTTGQLFSHYFKAYENEKAEKGSSDKMNECFDIALRGVVESIKTLHRKNIVYLDLKSDNVLWKLDKDGKPQCKLIDFQTALTYDESRRLQHPMLTPFAVEPELMIPWVYTNLYMKRPDITRFDYEAQCDMYSLGRTLIEAIGTVLGVEFDDTIYKELFNEEIFHKLDPRGIEIVPGLFEFNKQEINQIRQKNEELGDVFTEDIMDLLDELTEVRTERASIEEVVAIKSGRSSFYGTDLIDRVPPDSKTYEFEIMPDTGAEINGSIASKLIKIVDNVEQAHEKDELYLDIYLNGNDLVHLENRMSLYDAKRTKEGTKEGTKEEEFNPVFMEPEALITLLGAHALASRTADPEIKAKVLAASRIDYEEETAVHMLGRVLTRALGKGLGVQMFERPEWWDKYFEDYKSAIENGKMHDDPENEPVNYLLAQQNADIQKIKAANEKAKMYDNFLIELAEDMTKPRIRGMYENGKYLTEERISMADAKERLEAVLLDYETADNHIVISEVDEEVAEEPQPTPRISVNGQGRSITVDSRSLQGNASQTKAYLGQIIDDKNEK
ncbi:protein kinase, partial [Thermoproteota archaeon]